MSNENQTDREAALAARVKELETEREARNDKATRGGLFEQLWQTFTSIVPEWVAVAAMGVWLAFHGYIYSIDARLDEVNNQYSTVEKDYKKLEAEALSQPVDGGESLAVETAKAELAQKREDARKAKAEADAQSRIEGNTTLAIKTLDIEIDATQQAAIKAQAEADALLYREGGDTLAQRELRAKAVIAEMDAAMSRVNATLATGNPRAIVQVACQDNQFPELIDCPAQYRQAR